ncbi:hypothetical protein L1987_60062 [Smallanthus sonchifolius]|uniref:Uncharacterized protein n=1 Tax=Smallanthus sonchifolius TaxID=185202 RepID=A0ACB9D733_9ASTR|nr:hypothetical protein L1987_60062 [Smallanthus sonchifolius]
MTAGDSRFRLGGVRAAKGIRYLELTFHDRMVFQFNGYSRFMMASDFYFLSSIELGGAFRLPEIFETKVIENSVRVKEDANGYL